MKRIGLVLGAVLSLGFVGCGSSSSVACDSMSGGTHVCAEEACDSGDLSTAKSNCTANGGTSVSACTHTGAVGGCKITSSAGGHTCSATSWSYAGKASDAMTACSQIGGTFLSP